MKRSAASSDLLSDLPDDIVAKILGRLPILDAIRTSLLSRQWRYRWYFITNLILKNLDTLYSVIPAKERESFISRVLLPLRGPVHKFKLTGTTTTPSHFDLNQWLLCLSRHSIAELFLGFRCHFMAPSTLFQCTKLTRLELSNCDGLKLPLDFNGFEYLKVLNLYRVDISVTSLEKLVSGCPGLKYLILRYSHTKLLKIHAPFLELLFLEGEFEGFVLEKLRLLKLLNVRITGHHRNVLVKFQDQVPSLEKLIGNLYFTKYCNAGPDSWARDILHNHLRIIKLEVNFEDPKQVEFLLQLLRISHVLKILHVRAINKENLPEAPLDENFWSKPCYVGCKLSRLMEVMMTHQSGSDNEIELMKLLLLNSPLLKKMDVRPTWEVSTECKMKILVALVRCRRSSPEAEVVF